MNLMDPKVRDLYSKKSYELISDWTYDKSLKNFLDMINFIGL